MSPEAYFDRTRELGVSRGQLEVGFRPDIIWLGYEREATVTNPEASMRVNLPIVEDLSRFARLRRDRTPAERAATALRKCKPAARPLYESLAARGMTVHQLSERTGISNIVISHAFAGAYVSVATFKALWPLLTEQERNILDWPGLMKRRREVWIAMKKGTK